VPASVRQEFLSTWAAREALMRGAPGFQGFELAESAPGQYTVTSRWASVPQWEAWDLSGPARRSHLPTGIWQHPPARGEGFPETFIPIVGNYDLIHARY
jgi:antibiotic biosynthesis monooxygenase (ABM) superfamily enzyme